MLWQEAGFLWWRWHIGDAQAVQIANQEPGSLGATVFKIDDKTYSTRHARENVVDGAGGDHTGG